MRRREKETKPTEMDKMAEKEEVTAETSTEDAEKVVVEPYDAADIDFDTFCKSDMRVVKVKDCVAVQKIQKAAAVYIR